MSLEKLDSLEEAKDRLNSIAEMIELALNSNKTMLVDEKIFLERIMSIAKCNEDEYEEPRLNVTNITHMIVSCDASIKNNPGGPAAIGIVIQAPNWEEPIQRAQLSKAKTSNQAEYDAVYTALMTIASMYLSSAIGKIEVRSDSRLVVKQLRGEYACSDENLDNKRKLILEFVAQLPIPVEFVWRPRNSTPELKMANYLAQDAISVPRH